MNMKSRKRMRVDLISLIDMIFILVVFFMINNMTVQSETPERRFAIPTPKNERGSNAQVLIQIVDQNSFFWLDHNDFSRIDKILSEVWLPAETRYMNLAASLRGSNMFTRSQLDGKLGSLFSEVAAPGAQQECFIVIRCPDHIPYFQVIEIIKKINSADISAIEYGCVGGELRDIFQPGKITSRQLVEGNTSRKIIQISY